MLQFQFKLFVLLRNRPMFNGKSDFPYTATHEFGTPETVVPSKYWQFVGILYARINIQTHLFHIAFVRPATVENTWKITSSSIIVGFFSVRRAFMRENAQIGNFYSRIPRDPCVGKSSVPHENYTTMLTLDIKASALHKITGRYIDCNLYKRIS